MSEEELTVRERRELFVSEYRQRVLDVLSERTSPVALSVAAAEIAAREGDRSATSEERSVDIEAELHHIHLPKLNEAGVVDYDPESRLIYPEEGSSYPGDTGAGTSNGGCIRDESSLHSRLRRIVIEYFDESEAETASLADLARFAATRVDGSWDHRERSADRLQCRLHHVDLPKLAHEGIIEYDYRMADVRFRDDHGQSSATDAETYE